MSKVNHPSHYGGDTPYEAKKVIRAWGLGFFLGNAVKYISRMGKKIGESGVQDCEKAIWYLTDHLVYDLGGASEIKKVIDRLEHLKSSWDTNLTLIDVIDNIVEDLNAGMHLK